MSKPQLFHQKAAIKFALFRDIQQPNYGGYLRGYLGGYFGGSPPVVAESSSYTRGIGIFDDGTEYISLNHLRVFTAIGFAVFHHLAHTRT